MSIRRSPRPGSKAAPLPNQRLLRTTGWLVGLALLVGGLTVGLRAHAATSNASAASNTAAKCTTCGVVTAVEAHNVKGKGSGVGVVGGAVLGGLLGNQLGKGTGNTLATVGGAVAGGYAGNEVEKSVNKHTVYKTTVKMDDGSTRRVTVSHPYAIGAKVTVNGTKLKLQTP